MTTCKRIETLLAVLLSAGFGAALVVGWYWNAGLLAVSTCAWLYGAFTEPDFTEEEIDQ